MFFNVYFFLNHKFCLTNRPKLAEGKKKVDNATQVLWTFTNCLFVIGSMLGAFTAKFLMDRLGRKGGILIHHIFGIVGGILVLVSARYAMPVFLMISRFLFGVQGGMSCTLIPTYLSEISPITLRGRTGVIHQLFITIGIVTAQIFGLRQLLGMYSIYRLFVCDSYSKKNFK